MPSPRSILTAFVLFAVLLLPLVGCTGTTEECVGRVKEYEWGFKKQDCEHNCPDGTKCTWQSSTDGQGNKREWCGCSSAEPDNCHLYLETPKDGSPKADCTGVCAKDGDICTRKSKPKPGLKEISCDCEGKKTKMSLPAAQR